MMTPDAVSKSPLYGWATWGLFWLTVATIAAVGFFWNGFAVLLDAWSQPEYSHGPLIPVLSALMFLRDLKQHPIQPGPKPDRWPGVFVVLLSIIVAILGTVLNAFSLLAYAMIIWVAGILLISFGWKTGRHLWPPVLHLVFMLPLPGTLYYQVSTVLQLVSSELGVWFLRLADVPVFLEGNIIDLGVVTLHVAEACSGLRYLFPILSFSYIFAFLYQGPRLHKIILLLAAAPIAIFMNSLRIALAGILVQKFGLSWLEGFTHFFEGWVIFMASVFILIGIAWLMLQLNRKKMSLAEALDLDTDAILPQVQRLQYIQPSAALITAAVLMVASVNVWPLIPQRDPISPDRLPFAYFPREIGEWQQIGSDYRFSPRVERELAADDYHAVQVGRSPSEPSLDFFMAWYEDLSEEGVQHTPEICLPGAGWEISKLDRLDLQTALGAEAPFVVNRVMLQKGTEQMLVYYWFTHLDRTFSSNMGAKLSVLTRGLLAERVDGAIVRLISPLSDDHPEEVAEAQMIAFLKEARPQMSRFIPGE